MDDLDRKKLYYFSNIWGCPTCRKIPKSFTYISTREEVHKAIISPPYDKFSTSYQIDYRLRRGAASVTEAFHCPLCKHTIYNVNKDSWSEESDQLFELVKNQGLKEGSRLETIPDDLHFLSDGGKNIDACYWFLDAEYTYLLNIYNNWLVWNGHTKRFPPIPPRLLGVEEPIKVVVDKPDNYFTWNFLVGVESEQNLNVEWHGRTSGTTVTNNVIYQYYEGEGY